MKIISAVLISTASFAATAGAAEYGIASGSGSISFDMSVLLGQTPLNSLDAVFGITETRNECLGLPGNNPGSTVFWDINPVGTPSPAGRQIQGTTLTVDPNNVFGSWGPATSDSGVFVSGGEQVGFGGMTRWTLDPGIPGVLLFGDWGLRYSPSRAGTFAGATDNVRSGLVLTSNIDFPNAAFGDIGNLTMTMVGSTLTLSGDVLISDALLALGFPAGNLGLDIGDFNMTLNLVPAPGAMGLLGLAAIRGGRRRR